jgi:DNA-binding PadR family transcriptional regulator
VSGRRPGWKGPRSQVNIRLTPEGKRMLRRLAKQWKLPQSDVVEELLRAEAEKR